MDRLIYESKHVVIIGLFMLLTVLLAIPHVSAIGANPGVFPINSKPYGHAYTDWSVKWWQWLLPIPSSVSPLNDKSGDLCARNQTSPVWFLVGSNQGAAVRHCTVPVGMAIFFPAVTFECSYAEDATLTTEAQLRSCAVNGDQGAATQVSVDGVNVQNLQAYRVQSPLFSFVFPKDNIFGARPGPTQAVSDGTFIMLQPLAPGNHELHFSGVVVGNPTLGTQAFATDSTYHLTVK